MFSSLFLEKEKEIAEVFLYSQTIILKKIKSVGLKYQLIMVVFFLLCLWDRPQFMIYSCLNETSKLSDWQLSSKYNLNSMLSLQVVHIISVSSKKNSIFKNTRIKRHKGHNKRQIFISQTPNSPHKPQTRIYVLKKKILHIKCHLFARAFHTVCVYQMICLNPTYFSYLMINKRIVDSSLAKLFFATKL